MVSCQREDEEKCRGPSSIYARTRPATARASPPKETPTAWAAPVGAGVPVVPAGPEPLGPEPPVDEGEPVVTVAVPLVELTGAPELMMTEVVVPLTGTVTMGVLVTGTACMLVTEANYAFYEFDLPTTLLATLVTTATDEAGTEAPPDEAGTPDVAGGAWI